MESTKYNIGICIFVVLLSVVGINAQTALYNTGNLRIHEGGQLGFHMDLINDGTFDENAGLAGFYGSTLVNVSGAFMPVFFDVEIANDQGAALNTAINVTNNVNFVVGDFTTPRSLSDIYLNFIGNAFYVGEGDISKINGYATITDQQNFTFPVGDVAQLRPLILNSSSNNAFAKCAYFFENPNAPSTFSQSFNTELRSREIGAISTLEFWRMEGSVPSTVSLSWNERSNIVALTEDPNAVSIAGWSKAENRWVSLGTGALGGDLTNGFVSSNTFIPDDYEILTLATSAEPVDLLALDNYLLTPNGDGINDVLVIEGMELSPNNSLKIYDRNGLKVFEMVNYIDEFGGVSNVDNRVINREAGLPEGVYFYVVALNDLGLEYQGFLYLAR